MGEEAIRARAAGLRRVSRLSRWALAAGVALTGIFSATAAWANSGHATRSVSSGSATTSSGGATSGSSAGSSVSGGSLQAPSSTPSSSSSGSTGGSSHATSGGS